MFPLYNATFKRLPDTDGLKYWIWEYTSGENDENAVYNHFLTLMNLKNAIDLASLTPNIWGPIRQCSKSRLRLRWL